MRDDPPKDFLEAEELFREFLVSQGYPPDISWVFIEDLIPAKGGQYWARQNRRHEGATKAKRQYQLGLERNLGIALNAFGKGEYSTFASIFVPENETDAQFHMMGRCLKRTCSTSPVAVHVTTNLLHWLLLRFRNRALVRQFRELEEL